MKKVSVLITMDLEIAYDHDLAEQKKILNKIREDFNVPLTIFTTENAARLFADELKKLSKENHEIGSHGVEHSFCENYKILSESEIEQKVDESTEMIKNIIGIKPSCFRGPRMTTSALTQKELEKKGYNSDFSICSQRIDIFNSQGGCWDWLWAPRRPYRPSLSNPFKKGDVKLLVVPLSCLFLPFISGVMYLFGLLFMKLFFKILYIEALLRGTVIVYLFHSYEFCKKNTNSCCKELKKQPIHQRMYISDPSKRYDYHIQLLKFIKSHRNVVFKRAKELQIRE